MAHIDQLLKPKKRIGRPPGARNKRLIALEEKLIADLSQSAEQLEAGEFLQRIYRDPKAPLHLRLDAAKAVFRTEKPVLAAMAVQTNAGSLAERMAAAQARMQRDGLNSITIEGVIEAGEAMLAAPQSALQAGQAAETAPDTPNASEPVLEALDNMPAPISPARLRVLHELAARRSAPKLEDLL